MTHLPLKILLQSGMGTSILPDSVLTVLPVSSGTTTPEAHTSRDVPHLGRGEGPVGRVTLRVYV